MQNPVYLDNSATTPVDPRVADKMMSCLTQDGNFGNPASRSHLFGWRAEEAVEEARLQVAELIQADAREIVWTSGATEADNLALKGVAYAYRKKGRHIITSSIEHKAILDPCKQLEKEGFEVTYLKPNSKGEITVESVVAAITEGTILISLMHGNNELGVLTDINAVGAVAKEHGVLFHVDAAQTTGKVDIDVKAMNVDLMSLTAHKSYGPKGIGALYVRRTPKVKLEAQIHGGGHERGMRSGTLATHQIVGMGEAYRIAKEEMAKDALQISELRDYLWVELQKLGGVHLNGASDNRVAGVLNVGFENVDGEVLLMSLNDIAVSSGSACTSASLEPSYVLKEIGLDDSLAHASLRLSIGRFTSKAEVDYALGVISNAVSSLRGA
ncbi:IscS subfamily cysteine desulfurase [Marinomonas mediterranea]|jgi:cysteine desulfurase IscS|uniref:cysteine desulfurase n=1 Tax=Marinomonas mediterranea (strain ATCC 700492 / JCM 21426 / NBRC 103028 / MMB-1) TaxID=717774 RepID=F2JUS5_MARM1|nr:IscS subfamily cysteine desulfurase [Marinomonas mediterranea]ADZ90490.1 Cysteine desulfurase [Marinomonas mediterranea MMB-1]WCN08543.1 IscS subfamily cysteine desulfurase [Marinomonas mediterranea]WCN12597.1 IscS subfamily cysteine desulfurase [Marinomonas mediterranea]WCN16669.1 IscS subfamily cysteine desulfurase [Marinomonas mediterranea MMB-1]